MQFFSLLSVAAVLLIAVPVSYANLRARAFYALTNNNPSGDILKMEPMIDQAAAIYDGADEPTVLLQNVGNDPRCIFCRPGLGKRMSVQIRDPSFRRRA